MNTILETLSLRTFCGKTAGKMVFRQLDRIVGFPAGGETNLFALSLSFGEQLAISFGIVSLFKAFRSQDCRVLEPAETPDDRY